MISLPRLLLVSFLLALFAIGCTVEPGNSNAPVSTASPAAPGASPVASPAASTSPSPSTSEASVQVTLPLLNALLADEAFVREAKNKVKLSDEQINSIKQASQAAIDRLRAANAEDTDTDGTDAPERAAEQLRSLVGEDKARQLAAVANDYWTNGAPGEGGNNDQLKMLPGPNAVPTDTRVVVNIPAFRMDLFKDGSLVKTYKVGIGYPQFPLPLGLRKAQTVIFNPPWTPPDSPWVAKMKNATPGETIEPGSKDNPLGPIKIPIGLPSLIHGGKSPAKIGKFASHGCVGLTTPQIKDFSVLLLDAAGNQVSQDQIAQYLEDKTKTKSVKLDKVIPVELRYETIVLEDGKLHIYKDVYALHTNTEENLRKVLEAQGSRLEDLSAEQRQQALDALKGPVKNEVVIDVPQLAQKGYPVAVNLDDGKGKPQITQKKKKSA